MCLKQKPKLFCIMCAEGKVTYAQKYLCGCSAIMVVIIVILSLVISFGGSSGNSVEMSGDNESALVEESSGIHLLEINESGKCDTGGADWSWMEIAFVVIGFKFVLILTHICHYCVYTKKVVKRKVKRNVDIEMWKLDKTPKVNDRVIVPDLV